MFDLHSMGFFLLLFIPFSVVLLVSIWWAHKYR